MRPGIVSGIVTGNAPTSHADVLRGSSRVPAPLHAWRTPKNVCVGGYELARQLRSAIGQFFFMSLGAAPEVFEKVNLVSFLQVSKVRKDFFTHFLKPYLLIGYFLLQLVYLLLTDKSDQFVFELMHKTQKLWRQGK